MYIAVFPRKIWRAVFLLALVTLLIPSAFAQAPSKQWVETATTPPPVSGQTRLALILGNTHYGGDYELKNPENDAKAIAKTLAPLGFSSTVLLDGSLEQMSDALHTFTKNIRAAGNSSVALLYYSGHGIQVNGVNYLIPIGFKMPKYDRDIVRYALSAQSALDEMQGANAQVNIAILDACRNNPFAKDRDFGGKGLAKLEAEGVLIAYATAAGTTASDNTDGQNGLYTASLLPFLRTPGLTLTSIFARTRKVVYEASGKKQFPYVYDGLINAEEFCLLPSSEPLTASPLPTRFAPPSTLAEYRAQMITIPAGEFTMGSNADTEEEKPAHQVFLSEYKIGKTLVTVAMWEEFCQATNRDMPHSPNFNRGWAKKDHPIVDISWDDAQAYCQWANLKLPTEAQWEKAARGIDGRRFPWRNTFDISKLWCSTSKYGDAGGTTAVGNFPAGASPYGCLDMVGIAWQWCQDTFEPAFYKRPRATARDPLHIAGPTNRVLHGGSWLDAGADFFRASKRSSNVPTGKGVWQGLRCVSQ